MAPDRIGQEAATLARRTRGGCITAFVAPGARSPSRLMARAIAAECPGHVVVVVGAEWVGARGHPLEATGGVTLIAWGTEAQVLVLETLEPRGPVRWLEAPGVTGSGLLMLFAPATWLTPDWVAGWPPARTIGLGLSEPAVAIDATGHELEAPGVGVALRTVRCTRTELVPGVRLLTTPEAITQGERDLVLRVGDRSALDLLGTAGAALGSGPLLLAALQADEGSPSYLLRPIRGVDPERGGVFVTEEARPGTRLAIAAVDAASARLQLESAARRLVRDSAGGAPAAVLVLGSGAHGVELHGAYDVETRLLESALGSVPFVSAAGPLVIADHGPAPAAHLRSTALLFFTTPS